MATTASPVSSRLIIRASHHYKVLHELDEQMDEGIT
jgi:hypothetical protein